MYDTNRQLVIDRVIVILSISATGEIFVKETKKNLSDQVLYMYDTSRELGIDRLIVILSISATGENFEK